MQTLGLVELLTDISGLGTLCFHPVHPRDYNRLLGITWENYKAFPRKEGKMSQLWLNQELIPTGAGFSCISPLLGGKICRLPAGK